MKPKKQFKVNARVKTVTKHRPKAHFEKNDMKAWEEDAKIKPGG